MKLKKLLETPGVLSKASENLPRAIEFKDEMKKLFSDNIHKDYDWTKSIKGLYLVRVDNNYILFNKKTKELYYGIKFKKYEDGISIEWMENYSTIRGLTILVFTNIIKYDSLTDTIYSGDVHTTDNINLHSNLKKFTQLEIDIWDDKKKQVITDDPYNGVYNTNKQFRFKLKDETIIKEFIEDENIKSLFLNDGFDKFERENLETDITNFIDMYYINWFNYIE